MSIDNNDNMNNFELECEEVFEEYSDELPENMTESYILSAVEAILFAAGYPVTYKKLGSTFKISSSKIKELITNYINTYNGSDIPRGVMLVAFDDTCQLCTKEQYGDLVREALGIKKGGNLSQSSIETLAIIAYNEPVTKTFIETVRGVDSTYTVSNLLEKQLIEISGKLEVPGRPNLYRTTENFLRVFGLNSLDELPEVDVETSGIQEKIDFSSLETNDEMKEEITTEDK